MCCEEGGRTGSWIFVPVLKKEKEAHVFSVRYSLFTMKRLQRRPIYYTGVFQSSALTKEGPDLVQPCSG